MAMAAFRLPRPREKLDDLQREMPGESCIRFDVYSAEGAEALCDNHCAQGIGLPRLSSVHRAFEGVHVRWGTTTHILWARCPVVLAQHTSYPVLRKAHRSSPELVRYHALHAFRMAWKSGVREEFLRRKEQIGGVCAGPLRHGRQWNRARARARRGETKSLKRFGEQR